MFGLKKTFGFVEFGVFFGSGVVDGLFTNGVL